MPFFPLPSPSPLSPLSGCVWHGVRSGGTAAPAVIRDGPDDRMTKTCYGTASAAASVAMEATEEEEYEGCDSANPWCHLDNALLSLAEGILLRLIVTNRNGVDACD